jgi:hypothetical protein
MSTTNLKLLNWVKFKISCDLLCISIQIDSKEVKTVNVTALLKLALLSWQFSLFIQ